MMSGLLEKQRVLNESIAALKEHISWSQRELSTKNRELNEVNAEIEAARSQEPPKVSDHAVLRYLERVKGVDIESLKNEILSEPVLKMVKTLGGNGKYPNSGFKLVMKDNTVVTILK